MSKNNYHTLKNHSFIINSVILHLNYYLKGGLRAVVWTDTFQTLVVVGGLIGIIVIGCNHLGGLDRMWELAEAGGRVNFWKYVYYHHIVIIYYHHIVIMGTCFYREYLISSFHESLE